MVQSCSTTGRVSATPICGAGRGTGSGTASRDGIEPVTSGSPALSKRSGILAIWLWACCGGASLADFSSAAFSAATLAAFSRVAFSAATLLALSSAAFSSAVFSATVLLALSRLPLSVATCLCSWSIECCSALRSLSAATSVRDDQPPAASAPITPPRPAASTTEAASSARRFCRGLSDQSARSGVTVAAGASALSSATFGASKGGGAGGSIFTSSVFISALGGSAGTGSVAGDSGGESTAGKSLLLSLFISGAAGVAPGSLSLPVSLWLLMADPVRQRFTIGNHVWLPSGYRWLAGPPFGGLWNRRGPCIALPTAAGPHHAAWLGGQAA